MLSEFIVEYVYEATLGRELPKEFSDRAFAREKMRSLIERLSDKDYDSLIRLINDDRGNSKRALQIYAKLRAMPEFGDFEVIDITRKCEEILKLRAIIKACDNPSLTVSTTTLESSRLDESLAGIIDDFANKDDLSEDAARLLDRISRIASSRRLKTQRETYRNYVIVPKEVAEEFIAKKDERVDEYFKGRLLTQLKKAGISNMGELLKAHLEKRHVRNIGESSDRMIAEALKAHFGAELIQTIRKSGWQWT